MTPKAQYPWGQKLTLAAAFCACLLVVASVRHGHADMPRETEQRALISAEQAFLAGSYDQAALLVRGQTDAEAALLTARTLLTKALLLEMGDPEVFALASNALHFAELARVKAPDRIETHLNIAIALGLQADHLPMQQAIQNVEAGRAAIDTARALAPNNPWVLATDAGWHLVLTGRLGPVVANVLFSASRARGLELFRKARALAPDNAKILYHFAKVRILQGDGGAAAETRAAVHRLQGLEPADALDKALQTMASALLVQADAVDGASAKFGYDERP